LSLLVSKLNAPDSNLIVVKDDVKPKLFSAARYYKNPLVSEFAF